MMRVSWILCLIAGLHMNMQAQVTQFFQTPEVDSSRGLSGQLYSLAFFQNNEYFNSPAPGRSYLGNRISGRLNYRSGLHYISGGLLFQYRFGTPLEARVLPILTLNYGISKFLHVTLGTLSGGANHQLPETVMGRGYLYRQPLEYGVQFRVPGKRAGLDTWLDWRENTQPGDSTAEQFTQGTTLYYLPYNSDGTTLKLRGGLVFYHHGGQGLSRPVPVYTLLNYYAGIDGSYRINSDWSIQLRYLFMAFNNPSERSPIAWTSGSAHQLRVPVTWRKVTLGTGLFLARNYYAPFAGEIYSAYDLSQPDRKLVYGQLQWLSGTTGKFNLQFGSEFFYDLRIKKIDYNYCVLARFAIPGFKK